MKSTINGLQKHYQAALQTIDTWRHGQAEAEEEFPLHTSERNSGAAPELVEMLCEEIGEELNQAVPDELIALLLLHDGEDDYDDDGNPLLTTFPLALRLLSVEEIEQNWRSALQNSRHSPPAPDLDDPVDDDPRIRWSASPPSPTCIPFAGSPGLDYNFFIDLNPGPDGTFGQVLYNATEIDMEFLADSLTEFFHRYAAALEGGEFEVDGDQIICQKSMADALAPE